MAQTKLIIGFFFLAILLSQTEGRNLKFKNKNDGLQTHAKISGQDSTKFTGQSKFLPHSCSSLTACGNEAAFTPPTSVAAAEPQTPPPAAGHADDFRPTTPGHSPGIGHS